MKQLFALFLLWPGGESYLVDRDLTIEQCAGRAAMERMADSRWIVRCEPQANAFRVVRRSK
jgi:hypothetical protein